jgi:hypothetical protein
VSQNKETPKEDAVVESVKGRKKRHMGRKLAAGDMKVYQETTACQKATEADMEKIEPDPGMMHSAVEHQDVPREKAARTPVKELKKRHRGQKSTAGRCGESKKLTRGNCGSRRKLAATCRKMSCHATVAWSKRNILRKIRTQENCGWRKGLAVAGMRTTRRARVAWRKENFVRKDWARNQAEQGTPKPRKDGKRLWKGQELNDGLREGLKQWQRSKIRVKTQAQDGNCTSRNEKTDLLLCY